jgi:hypothetical protein
MDKKVEDKKETCGCLDNLKIILDDVIKFSKSKKRESDELDLLFSALSKAQANFSVARTESTNPFYKSKYADLKSVIEASRQALTEQGLCIVQRILTNGNDQMYMFTRLGHTSGQWIESKMPINPNKDDIQSIGKYITYIKRYNYAAMVGVVASDEDDDGESNMPRDKKSVKKNNISKEQLKILSNELITDDKLLEKILKGYGINKLSDLPAKKFEECLAGINKRKNGDK